MKPLALQETNHLKFKNLNLEDAEAIHAYAANEDVARYIGWRLKADLEETQDLVKELLAREKKGSHMYASVLEKKSNRLIGTLMVFNIDALSLHGEIGYVLHQDYWYLGYGTQMVSALKKYCFSHLHLRKIYAKVASQNKASQRILEKNGFFIEAVLREHFFIESQFNDCLIFSCQK